MNLPRTTTKGRARTIALATFAGAAILGGAGYALGAPLLALRGASPGEHAVASSSVARALSIRAWTPRQTIAPGASATFRLGISRGVRLVRPLGRRGPRVGARIWLSAARSPRTIRAIVGPRSTRSTRAKLTLAAAASTRPGTYHLRLNARGRLRSRDTMRYAHAIITLVVVASRQRSFTIAGTTSEQLVPGRDAAVELRLSNPHRFALRVSRLDVRIDSVLAPQADAAHPCTARDFAVVQPSLGRGLRLAGSSARSLRALGASPEQAPRIAMIDRAVNQDGCKHATLKLTFAGRATAATS